MTRYLLDRDVLRAVRQREVSAWLGSVPDAALYLSAVTVMEGRKGIGRAFMRAADAEAAGIVAFEAAFDAVLDGFGDRILPIDRRVADVWGRLLGQREAHVMDAALAATAIVHGLAVVTRNLRDFRGRGVRLLDPFRRDRRSRSRRDA